MSHLFTLSDFLSPVNIHLISDDEGYSNDQIGKVINVYDTQMPDITDAEIVLIGCGEERGSGPGFEKDINAAPDAIRAQFYRLFYWHNDIRLADLGNVKAGATLSDTIAALKTVIGELTELGKTVVILGGSHDLTLAQYYMYADRREIVEASCVDARINLSIESPLRSENFLMEMLTGEPNFIRHYNHIAFQSYYTHPDMLETMDKLRFDCFRVGKVKEAIEEMEPAIRHSRMISFDMAALANAYAPVSDSPNGLNGEDACILMQYAGLSPEVNTVGIYGFSPSKDKDTLTARQISQMLWYLIDGRSRCKQDTVLSRDAIPENHDSFREYHIAFGEIDTIFLQSKKTGRWWMQLPGKNFIACTEKDYITASLNEIPERWLRAQERS